MKKVTLENYKTDVLYQRVVKAVETVLSTEKYVTPVKVFLTMGLLDQKGIENWRKGRVPYLERVIICNLSKANRILRILRFHAHDLNLKPSITIYKRKARGRKVLLRFSKSNDKKIEEAYSRHYVVVGTTGANKYREYGKQVKNKEKK